MVSAPERQAPHDPAWSAWLVESSSRSAGRAVEHVHSTGREIKHCRFLPANLILKSPIPTRPICAGKLKVNEEEHQDCRSKQRGREHIQLRGADSSSESRNQTIAVRAAHQDRASEYGKAARPHGAEP